MSDSHNDFFNEREVSSNEENVGYEDSTIKNAPVSNEETSSDKMSVWWEKFSRKWGESFSRYWDKVGLINPAFDNDLPNSRKSWSFISDIMVSDMKNTISHSHKSLNKELEEVFAKNIISGFLAQREWREGLIYGLLYIPEIILKFPAAAIVEAYIFSRDKLTKACFKKARHNALWYIPGGLSLIPTAFCFFANALIAQTLFFLGNAVSHVRYICDGIVGALTGKGIKNGLTVAAKGALNLLGDILVGGICYGLSFIFPHLAPALVPATSTIQSALFKGVVNFFSTLFTNPASISIAFPSLKQVGFSVVQFAQAFLGNAKTTHLSSDRSWSVSNVDRNKPWSPTYNKLKKMLNCCVGDDGEDLDNNKSYLVADASSSKSIRSYWGTPVPSRNGEFEVGSHVDGDEDNEFLKRIAAQEKQDRLDIHNEDLIDDKDEQEVNNPTSDKAVRFNL